MSGVSGESYTEECNGRKYPTIVISGPPGSGKTTYSLRLARDLGLPYYSAGRIFREIAKSKGLTLEEMSKLADKDPSFDILIDKTTVERAVGCGGIIEGHLTAWVLKDIADVSIYFTAPTDVRLKRILEREKSDVARETFAREESQYSRYKKYYGVDINVYNGFDLVVDTSKAPIDDIYKTVLTFVQGVLGGAGKFKTRRT